MNIEDFIPYYPDIDNDNFQQLITDKVEFNSLQSTKDDKVPIGNRPFNAQKLLQRYIERYDNLLVMWRAGTGKTNTIILPAEYYRTVSESIHDILTNTFETPYPIKRCLVLVKGDTLENEFRNQLVCKFTDKRYITESVRDAETERGRQNAMTRSIRKWYDIEHLRSFANSIRSKSDKDIINEYSGYMVVIDEVHNLTNTEDMDSGEHKKKEKDTTTYNEIKRFLRLIKRSKQILLSATPMIDSADEIVDIINLLNKEDIPKDINVNMREGDNIAHFKAKLSQQLEPYIRGKISYLRETMTGSVKEYQGNKTGNLAMPLVDLYMGDIQEKTYLTLTSGDRFRYNQRHAGNIVYPNGEIGSEGEKKYITINSKAFKFDITDNDFRVAFSAENIHRYSTKFKYILDTLGQTNGKFYVFSNFIIGGGIVSFACVLELYGYERFTGDENIFTKSGSKLPPLCDDPESLKAVNPDKLKKRLRYAVITSDISLEQRRSIMSLFNCKENMYGEYLKGILGGPSSGEGINLLEVTNVFILEGQWNMSRQYQAESRGIRSGSHDRLITVFNGYAADVERKIKEGKMGSKNVKEFDQFYKTYGYNKDSKTFTVRVHLLAAFTHGGDSTDYHIYNRAEVKDRSIKLVERVLKESAIDCFMNKKRNVRESDIDGTSVCDYMECDIKCKAIEPTELDYSTFNAYYIDTILDDIITDIINYFDENIISHATLEELVENLDQPMLYIKLATEKIISEKRYIINRYGYKVFFNEEHGILFTHQNISDIQYDTDIYPLSYYSMNIYITRLNNIRSIVKRAEIDLRFLEGKNLTDKLKALRALDYITLSNIVKELFVMFYENTINAQNFELMRNLFNYYNFIPKSMILNLENFNFGIGNVGRPKKEENIYKLKPKKLSPLDDSYTPEDDVDSDNINLVKNDHILDYFRRVKDGSYVLIDVVPSLNLTSITNTSSGYISNWVHAKINQSIYAEDPTYNIFIDGKWRKSILQENMIIQGYIESYREELYRRMANASGGLFGIKSRLDNVEKYHLVDKTSESFDVSVRSMNIGKEIDTYKISDLQCVCIYKRIPMLFGISLPVEYTAEEKDLIRISGFNPDDYRHGGDFLPMTYDYVKYGYLQFLISVRQGPDGVRYSIGVVRKWMVAIIIHMKSIIIDIYGASYGTRSIKDNLVNTYIEYYNNYTDPTIKVKKLPTFQLFMRCLMIYQMTKHNINTNSSNSKSYYSSTIKQYLDMEHMVLDIN